MSKIKSDCDDVLRELAAEKPEDQPTLFGTCPVRTLREVKPDGTDIMLGDLELDRCGYPDVQDVGERESLAMENMLRPVGDPGIAWCIGGKKYSRNLVFAPVSDMFSTDYLASSHQGRGIMSAALTTIITKWAIPRMGARLIRGEAFKGNIGSVRVFEKNGFVLEDTVDFEYTTNAGMKMTGMHVLWWRKAE